jgi:hypothetical protein
MKEVEASAELRTTFIPRKSEALKDTDPEALPEVPPALIVNVRAVSTPFFCRVKVILAVA